MKKIKLVKWQSRAIKIFALLLVIFTGVFIIMKTFNDNVLFFFTPSQVIEKGIKPSARSLKVGGLVKEGSIHKHHGDRIVFTITDNQNEMTIEYTGIAPNLFKEKQGVVAVGKLLEPSYFVADEILAKHDENYMPPEVAKGLR